MKPACVAVPLLCLVAVGGCGGGAAPQGVACTGACECVDNRCACAAGESCALGPDVSDGDVIDSEEDLPSNVVFDCNSRNTCDVTCGTGCTTHCEAQTMCTGSCGSDCTAACAGGSTCDLSLGDNSQAECAGMSDCVLDAGNNAVVGCTGTSTCFLNVGEGSTIDCGGTSVCVVECPEGECQIACDGAAQCFCDGPGCQFDCMHGLQDCDGIQVCAGATCPTPPAPDSRPGRPGPGGPPGGPPVSRPDGGIEPAPDGGEPVDGGVTPNEPDPR